MSTVVAGIVIGLIGFANLATGRKHPERINARLQRGIGWVGIVFGSAIIVNGIRLLVRPPQ